MAALVTEHHAEKDAVIFEQGEWAKKCFVIVHGEAESMMQNLKEPEKEVKGATDDVVGEMSIISGEPRIASLIAVEDCHFLCFDKNRSRGFFGNGRSELCDHAGLMRAAGASHKATAGITAIDGKQAGAESGSGFASTLKSAGWLQMNIG